MNQNLFKKSVVLFLTVGLLFVFSACETGNSGISNGENDNYQEKLKEMTEKENFYGVVELLNTPEKVVDYKTEYFEHIVDKYGEGRDGFLFMSPEEVFLEQEGTCSNFSAFSSYVLDYHGYDIKILYWIAEDQEFDEVYGNIYGHTITIVEDDNGDFTYLTNIGNSQFDLYGPFNNIKDVLKAEEERVNADIFYHGFNYLGTTGEEIKVDNINEAKNKLDKPDKLLNYIAREFDLLDFDETAGINEAEQTFEEHEGNRHDLDVLISYILEQNDYEANILAYQMEDEIGNERTSYSVIYKNNSWNSIIDYTGVEPFHLRSHRNYSTLDELLNHIIDFKTRRGEEKDWSIRRYALIEAGSTDFHVENDEWIEY